MTVVRKMAVGLAAAAVLAACGEDPGNRAPGERAPDTKSYQAPAQGAYVAPGWKSGDEQSWEEHLRKRAQGQNEYSRVGSGS